MPRHHHQPADHCSCESNSSEELYTHIQVPRPSHRRHGSVVSSHHHHHVHDQVYAPPKPAYPASNLAVPVIDVGGRKRASSTSGMPQPNIIINADSGSRRGSRDRHRPRSHSRGRYWPEDDEESYEEAYYRGRYARTPSPRFRDDYDVRKAMEKLKCFEQEKAEEEAEKRYKVELEIQQAKEQLQKTEEERKRKELDAKAVEAYQKKTAADKKKEEQEKADLEKRVEEKFRLAERAARNVQRIEESRPLFTKVSSKTLFPETLDHFDLPWYYDTRDPSFIVIEDYISGDYYKQLSDHTNSIRRRKLITPAITKEVIVKPNDTKGNRLFVVRRKY